MDPEKPSVDRVGKDKSEPEIGASEAGKSTPSEKSLDVDVEAQKETSDSAQVTEESPPTQQITYLLGWRLHLLTLA
jgi:hypothetical protein